MSDDKYVVVVTCVVLCRNIDGQLQTLILKRSDEEAEGPGLWTIPGGKIKRSDWGEEIPTATPPVFECGLDRATIREVRGETGVEISANKIITMQNKALAFIRKDGKTLTLVHRFWALCEQAPQIVLGCKDEVNDHKWVTQGELPQFEFIGNVGEDIVVAMKECTMRNPGLHI